MQRFPLGYRYVRTNTEYIIMELVRESKYNTKIWRMTKLKFKSADSAADMVTKLTNIMEWNKKNGI